MIFTVIYIDAVSSLEFPWPVYQQITYKISQRLNDQDNRYRQSTVLMKCFDKIVIMYYSDDVRGKVRIYKAVLLKAVFNHA